MGIAVGGSRGGTFVEINVVPLIDVLLVLLVIFMIIPHSQKGLKAELPQRPPKDVAVRADPEVIVVQVLGDGSLRINEERVSWAGLQGRLEEIFNLRDNRIAFVRGDSAIEFQVVAKVIDIMVAAGVRSVGLMTPGLEDKASAD